MKKVARRKTKIVVDPEFKALVPPLPEGKLANLKASIKTEGCRDALVTWPYDGKRILIDGHNRKSICDKGKITYEVEDVREKLETRSDVKVWIAKNQMGRRELSSAWRAWLALEVEDDLKAKTPRGRPKKSTNSYSLSSQGNILDQLAQMADVGREIISRVRAIRYFDPPIYLEDAPEEGKDDARESIVAEYDDGTFSPDEDVLTEAKFASEEIEDIGERYHEIIATVAKARVMMLADEISVNGAFKEFKKAANAHEVLQSDILRIKDTKAAHYRGGHCDLFLSEFQKIGKNIDDASVDWIITDPPYPKEYAGLYLDLTGFASRVLKPGGGLIVMTGQLSLPEFLSNLVAGASSELQYYWTMCYHMPGKKVHVQGRDKINTSWKPLILFTRGKPSFRQIGSDVFTSAAPEKTDRADNWQQSVSGMRDIITRMTKRGDRICDPMMGSGTTGVAAIEENRYFIGIEMNKSQLGTAVKKIGAVEGEPLREVK